MKLSIITINYNNLSGLRRTLDSVVSQSWKEFEWIIIDGGSTDGSRELLKEYQEYFAFWCSEPDNGVYNAQNKGIKKAKGDYVLILNSGDCLASPTVLQDSNSYGFTHDFIVGNMVVFDKGEKYLWDIKPEMLTARQFFYGTLPHPGTFIRRSMFDKFGLYDESMKICADWKFFVDAILLGNATIEKIPVTISIFEGGGVSDTQLELSSKERQAVLSKIFPPLVQKDYIMIDSLLELRRVWFFDKMYSLLYRSSILYQKIFKKTVRLGYNFHKI